MLCGRWPMPVIQHLGSEGKEGYIHVQGDLVSCTERPTCVTSETQVSLCCPDWFQTEPQIPSSQAGGTRSSHICSQVLQSENAAKEKENQKISMRNHFLSYNLRFPSELR